MLSRIGLIGALMALLALGMAHADTALTTEFGDVVPLFEEARVIAVKQTRAMILAHFKAQAGANAILAFYGHALKEKGWRLTEPTRPAAILKGLLQSRRGRIFLTLTCTENQDRSTDFRIRLDYDQGRE